MNVTLLASGAAAPLLPGAGHAAIDRYMLPARSTAANPPHAAAAVDSMGHTDGQADGRILFYCGEIKLCYIDLATHYVSTKR